MAVVSRALVAQGLLELARRRWDQSRPPHVGFTRAKIASTVDVMSHGRLDFGIGAGWFQEEFEAYGYPFPDGPERLRMLVEMIEVIDPGGGEALPDTGS